MSLPIYKAFINSSEDVMDFMGFVEQPAHSKTMRFFNDNNKPRTKHVFNEERQIVTGVAISTNQPIYRRDDSGEYYMYFDKNTTRELGRRLLESNYGGNVNINHDQNQIVKSARIDEIFYIDKSRGIEAPSEFSDQNLQDGSMLISYHIADKKEFKSLKEKNLTGFSIEVFIDLERTKFEKVNHKSNIKMSKNKKSLFERIKEMFDEDDEQKEFAEATTVDGLTLKWDGELTPESTVIYITKEGEEDVLAPEGVHVVAEDDKQLMLTVGADGVLVSLEEVQEEEMSEVEEAIELMAKQFSKQSEEFTKAKETIKDYEKRFENIETKLDSKKEFKKDIPKKSIGKAIRG